MSASGRRFASLTFLLAVSDFKVRFAGSVLGYVWTLMRPLLVFGVLYLVFTRVVRFGQHVQHYPVYLISGLVLFNFVSEATTLAVTSLVDRASLVRKIAFPRMVVPLAAALNALFNLAMGLVAVVIFALANGVAPRVSWLQVPLLLAFLLAFVVGLSLLLSPLFVRYRDVRQIWEVLLQLLFYASPVIYVMSDVPEAFKPFEVANPLAVVVTQMRHAFIDPSAPTAADVFGGAALLIPVAVVAAVLALGAWVFARERPRLAESL
jgi:ABC-2 type transport system permease protein